MIPVEEIDESTGKPKERKKEKKKDRDTVEKEARRKKRSRCCEKERKTLHARNSLN
ncbi:MAG: hypothetical protein R3C26_11200 [Calditrichia bacterium]